MRTRRILLTTLAACAAVAFLWPPGVVKAAAPTVEIIALHHSPVQNALKPVRSYLGKLGARVRVVELDAGSPVGEKRIGALGLKGHVPILLVIDGSYRFKRSDGSAVEFKDFPSKAANPLGLNGTWTEADLEAAVDAQLAKQEKRP